MKQKGKRKKDREGRYVIVKKYKSFVKSKRIFWKQGTDAKSLFSGMNQDKDGWIHWTDEFPTVVSQCHKRDAWGPTWL